jgi:23S rRNA pseudouridine955/2504/2580 synthase/23S rRNA pseudouridine1911/1915/1917 synthase
MNLSSLIIEETSDFVALNKPSGLLSIPDREGKEISLKQMLKNKYGEIFTVHRLDKETSGLIVFAKTASMHKHLSMQFEAREMRKIYVGLVVGSLLEKKGTIDKPIGEHPAIAGQMIIHRKGKNAITDFEVIDDFAIYSWMQFQIHTGRTHQIRVHMKDLGHPIVCDKIYGDGKPIMVSSLKSRYKLSKNEEEERPLLGRLALHAFQLSFMNESGETINLEAPIHKDIKAVLQQLSKRK